MKHGKYIEKRLSVTELKAQNIYEVAQTCGANLTQEEKLKWYPKPTKESPPPTKKKKKSSLDEDEKGSQKELKLFMGQFLSNEEHTLVENLLKRYDM